MLTSVIKFKKSFRLKKSFDYYFKKDDEQNKTKALLQIDESKSGCSS